MSFPLPPSSYHILKLAVNLGIVTQISFPSNCSPHVVTLMSNLQFVGQDSFDYMCLFITALESLIEELVTECAVLVHAHCDLWASARCVLNDVFSAAFQLPSSSSCLLSELCSRLPFFIMPRSITVFPAALISLVYMKSLSLGERVRMVPL